MITLNKIRNLFKIKKKLNTITTKLLMLFLFMTIIPLFVLAQFSTDLISTSMKQRAAEQLSLNIKISETIYNQSLANLKALTKQIVETSIEPYYSENSKSTKKISDYLNKVAKRSEISYILIVNKNKTIAASSNPSVVNKKFSSYSKIIEKVFEIETTISATDILSSNDYNNVIEKKYHKDSSITELGGSVTRQIGLSQVIVTPIINEDKSIDKVIVAGKLLANENMLVDSIGELTGSSIMFAQILSNGTGIVVSTNINTDKGNRAVGKIIFNDIIDTIYTNKSIQKREWQIREYQIAKYYPLYGFEGNIIGFIYVGIPENEFTFLVDQNIKLLGIISIIGLFAAIILSAIFSRSITSPILKLAEAAQNISQGDLSIRVNVKGSYELSQMGEAFNLMTENLQREERLRDDFVATLTHDLKVPLLAENQTIAYMLRGIYGELNQEQKEILDVVQSTNTLTLEMVNTLLEVYRYDAGKNLLLKYDVDLKNLIDASLLAIKPLADEKKLNITVIIPSTKIMVNIDEREYKRVIHNILSNAVTSTLQRGSIRLSVNIYNDKKYYYPGDKEYQVTTLKNKVPLENFVLVSIYDTGIGIEKEDMDTLFKRFSGNKGRRPSSIGLGLYYSYQVVTAHGGVIWAESQEGIGTAFKFTIPLGTKNT